MFKNKIRGGRLELMEACAKQSHLQSFPRAKPRKTLLRFELRREKERYFLLDCQHIVDSVGGWEIQSRSSYPFKAYELRE